MQVPVTAPGVPNAHLYGELCLPDGDTPSTVQFLVHGGYYTHEYWDFPYQPSQYSYVDRALDEGYATFNVDRLATGQSTRPLSLLVTLQASAGTLHQVITKLRDGTIGGHAFDNVVWVGHSLGSIYAWVEASVFQDVDAFVLTGIGHAVKLSWLTTSALSSYPAALDPKFFLSLLDPGYLTTVPGTRGNLFYYSPTADPAVIALDEQLKDTGTATEGASVLPLFSSPPPATAPSRSIVVPTLLVMGERDNVFCAPPDGLTCTEASIAAAEGPYYSAEAQLEVQVTNDTGHDLQLHTTAPQTTDDILNWIRDQVPL